MKIAKLVLIAVSAYSLAAFAKKPVKAVEAPVKNAQADEVTAAKPVSSGPGLTLEEYLYQFDLAFNLNYKILNFNNPYNFSN